MNLSRLTMLVAGLVTAFSAWSQTFPQKRIMMIVPYAAGGPTDIVSRLLAQKMGPSLGQSVVVENKPGAATQLGAEYVKGAEKDGYTLLMAAGSTFSSNPHIFKNIRYKLEDFNAVSLVTVIPFVLNVSAKLPVKDLREFIAWAKKKPNGVTFGTTGVGSTNHVQALNLAKVLGIKIVDVPYKGAALSNTAVMTGEVDAQVDSIPGPQTMHRAGTSRILAMMVDERWPGLPEVPTMKELGFSNADGFSWFALMTPAGVPTATLDRLSDATRRALDDAAIRKQLLDGGQLPRPMDPQQTMDFIRRDAAAWGTMIRENNIPME